MRMRDDGSIQSSNVPSYDNVGRREDNSVYRCMVTRIIFVDDPLNITANSSNPRVLYECVVLGGFSSGQLISNCRLSSDFGGNFNFYERTLRAASKDVSKTKLASQDGDIVLVQFIQGHTAYPMIISLDNGINTVGSIGAKAADGQVLNWQYNGINSKIDKNGNLTLTRLGGSYNENDKVFTPTVGGKQVKVEVKGQSLMVTLANGLSLAISGDADSATIFTSGGAKLKLAGSKVAIGTSSTELLQQISDQLDKIATFLSSVDSSHTHLGNLGFPSGPPIQASGFTTLASDLQTIKGKVDGIKGSL